MTGSRRKSRFAFVLRHAAAILLLGGALPVLADDALYGPAAPPDSTFLRAFNATTQVAAGGPVADRELPALEPHEGCDFVFFAPGKYTISLGNKKKTVNFAKNRYYTAVLMPDRIQVFENEPYANRMKALLLVYNLMDGTTISLHTADGRPVIEKIAPFESGRREVNALKIGFALHEKDQKLTSVRPVTLERGKAFSLFVGGTRSHPIPTWIIN